jgi:hypothetical protein
MTCYQPQDSQAGVWVPSLRMGVGWLWVRTSLVEANAGERSNDGLREHGNALIVTLGIGTARGASLFDKTSRAVGL